MSNSTRTPGLTAWVTANGVDLLTRTATTSVRDSISYADLDACEVAGRAARVELGDNIIAFATEKLSLLLKPYTGKSGETYYWAPLETIVKSPSISFAEAKKLADAAKKKAARKLGK